MKSKIDEYREYRRELTDTLGAFGSEIDSGQILGSDAGQFLCVSKGNRGVELYRGDADEVIIDPALDEELQGEISFLSCAEAIEAALRWLNGCSRGELFPGNAAADSQGVGVGED